VLRSSSCPSCHRDQLLYVLLSVLRVCQLCSRRPLVLANPIKRALVSSSAQACAVSTTSTLPAAARVGRFANATRRKKVVRHAMTLLHVRMATKNPLQSVRNARRATNDLPTRAGSRCWYTARRWAAAVTFDGAGVMTVASRHYVCRPPSSVGGYDGWLLHIRGKGGGWKACDVPGSRLPHLHEPLLSSRIVRRAPAARERAPTCGHPDGRLLLCLRLFLLAKTSPVGSSSTKDSERLLEPH